MRPDCVVIRDFKRPDPGLVRRFEGVTVANLDDAMGRDSAVDSAIVPLNRSPLLGTAFTVKVPAGDNLFLHIAMDLAKPGDVIVIDAGGETRRSTFGELMVAYCRARGVRGIVVDGAIRDAGALMSLEDFNVYARGVTPDGPYKNGAGEVNTPVSVGGRIVFPGDIVLGDADGVVFVRPGEAPSLLETVRRIEADEARIMATIEADGVYFRPWVEEKIGELGVEFLDYADYTQ